MPKCEFCERTFEKGPYKRVLRGQRHIFCSESCFVLYHYQAPKFDMDEMYRQTTVSVAVEASEQIIEEVRE